MRIRSMLGRLIPETARMSQPRLNSGDMLRLENETSDGINAFGVPDVLYRAYDDAAGMFAPKTWLPVQGEPCLSL